MLWRLREAHGRGVPGGGLERVTSALGLQWGRRAVAAGQRREARAGVWSQGPASRGARAGQPFTPRVGTSGGAAPRHGESAKLRMGRGVTQAVLRDTWSQSREQDGLGRQRGRRGRLWTAARWGRGGDLRA